MMSRRGVAFCDKGGDARQQRALKQWDVALVRYLDRFQSAVALAHCPHCRYRENVGIGAADHQDRHACERIEFLRALRLVRRSTQRDIDR